MAYKNQNGQPRERCMVAAYSLVNDFGATQEAVAKVMITTQGTIANWVKEVKLKREIQSLQAQLEDARAYTDTLAEQLQVVEHPRLN